MFRKLMTGAALTVLAVVACGAAVQGTLRWSAAEVEEIRSLWIGSLGPLPADPTNRVADDAAAVALGHRLFFDTRFSADGQVSCGTCHKPELDFQDGIPLGRGVGVTGRRTMPVTGTARLPFLFWDGRKDSQWAQALGPLESPVEHGGTRALYAHLVAEHYAPEYEALFGPLPDLSRVPRHAGPVEDPEARRRWDSLSPADRDAVNRVFANVGKAIAAYERRLEHGPSRFDRYAESLVDDGRAAEGILSRDEEAGLRLFLGKGNCTQCHNGPLFTDGHFHNTGVPGAWGLPDDPGRLPALAGLLEDEFNCVGLYSDDPTGCAELRFLPSPSDEMVRALKPPSLRNVAERSPYMHQGQLTTLAEVLDHYDRAPRSPAGRSALLEPLRLKERERRQLEAFLRTLSGPVAAPAHLLRSPWESPGVTAGGVR